MLLCKESVFLQLAVKILHVGQHRVRDSAAASAVQMIMRLCIIIIPHILAQQLDPDMLPSSAASESTRNTVARDTFCPSCDRYSATMEAVG